MLMKLMPAARVKVLAFLLLNASEEFHLREIARRAGVPLQSAQRELALLEEIALIERHRRGRQVFVSVQTSHPLFEDLRSLLLKSDGLVIPLRKVLEAIDGKTLTLECKKGADTFKVGAKVKVKSAKKKAIEGC